jgi:hypothetical protein
MIKIKEQSQTNGRREFSALDDTFCSELIMLYMLLENDQITVMEFSYRKNRLLNPDDQDLS